MPELPVRPAPECEALPRRRVLVLGWNHRVPTLLEEFAAYPEEAFAIDIVSQVSAAKREKRLAAEAISAEHLEVRQLELDYTVPAYLQSVDPAGYDNLVLLPSERLKSHTESDARTILGYILLRELMEGAAKAPPVLVELSDPGNAYLFENRRGEVIVSPVIISHMLAQVALRRELRVVFDELFGAHGAEFDFRPGVELGEREAALHADALAKLLARRSMEREQLTPSGHFRIHYDLKGSVAVDPTDDDGNGTAAESSRVTIEDRVLDPR